MSLAIAVLDRVVLDFCASIRQRNLGRGYGIEVPHKIVALPICKRGLPFPVLRKPRYAAHARPSRSSVGSQMVRVDLRVDIAQIGDSVVIPTMVDVIDQTSRRNAVPVQPGQSMRLVSSPAVSHHDVPIAIAGSGDRAQTCAPTGSYSPSQEPGSRLVAQERAHLVCRHFFRPRAAGGRTPSKSIPCSSSSSCWSWASARQATLAECRCPSVSKVPASIWCRTKQSP